MTTTRTFSNCRLANYQQKEFILEPHLHNQNMNAAYLTSFPTISLEKSEELVEKKYLDLLIQFFDTHQPKFIFEPVRKEYYWTNDSFDDEKLTHLEKLLQNTSYFVQSLFWYVRIVLAIFITIPIEILHTILAGLIKPILIRLPIILSDTLIKPLYSGIFNGFILPIGICFWNTSELIANIFEPFIRLCSCFQRKSSDHQIPKKNSILYV